MGVPLSKKLNGYCEDILVKSYCCAPMCYRLKTFELLGWVKTHPESLKVFTITGILGTLSTKKDQNLVV